MWVMPGIYGDAGCWDGAKSDPDVAALHEHITKEEFLAFYPQFAAAPDVWIDALVTECKVAFNRCVWGGYTKRGEAYYIAHYLWLHMTFFEVVPPPDDDGPQLDPGFALAGGSSVTDFKAGSVEWQKDSGLETKLMEEPFSRTLFGQAYLSLRNYLAVGLVTVT